MSDFLEGVDSVADERGLFELIAQAARDIGFDYCSCAMPSHVSFSSKKTVVFSSHAAKWTSRCVEAWDLNADLLKHLGGRWQQPLIWNDDLPESTLNLWKEARKAGLRIGWALATPDGRSVGGILTLARAEGPLTVQELASKEVHMRWLAGVAHQEFRRVRAMRADISLSLREREVLRWAADGKSAADISEIMSISVATVKFHTRNASEKLGVLNRTAAVARAVALGLLN